ncbi:hypothetical protein JCM8547_003104 [Rhodosporidiobolus lusitaniae]
MTAQQTAEQVFGWLGTILWCIQLIPQVWLNFRRKTTQGTSPYLFVCWVVSGATLGIYAIVENINIPIIVQPHCYGSICAFIICQIFYYDRQWKWYSAFLGGFGAYAVLCTGFEVAMVFATRAAEDKGITGVTMMWGIISAVMLGAGFIPQFYEIYKLKEVVGISYLFLFMDSLGAVFSILSLAFKHESLDIIALVGYVVIIAFEAFVGLLALVLNKRAANRRAQLASTCPSTRDPSPARRGDIEKQVEVQEQELREKEEQAEQVLPQVLPPAQERELADKVANASV